MTFFWSSWITILSIMCWAAILGVLLMVLKYKPELEDDGTTGHAYDGIKEYDKPLPKWWLVIFFGSIVWAIAYWIFFPAIFPSKWDGLATVEVDGETVPWTSKNELYSELESNNKVFTDNFEKNILAKADASGATATLATLADMQATMRRSDNPPADLQTQIDQKVAELAPYVEKLSENPNALKVGSRLFLQNCAVCHGSNAKGALGYPNLTDNDWLYGGAPENILTTLHNGRVGGMAAWRDQIGEDGVRAVSEYVLSISGNQQGYDLDQTKVAQGEVIFNEPTNCVLCHGDDAKGMISTGAPNLTDDIWLYGGDRESIRETLRYGRAGVMPEWQTKLGNERIMLLAAYVYSLSDKPVNSAKAATATATTEAPAEATAN
ncbi:cytochrome-c oxidase, cbb3-type subunit III [Psychrobacter celer]|uniref:Cytochrome c oxidase subunit III n=1 Tax=Psychrobacter halodurans TaxID=2818439 RepID=A0AAW4ITS0_9GAMM|nr:MULTISPECIES: cytochrome-c oxidase, cbb3-type subunit III [Psychrobacter]MBO1516193.1 cytochrome-c oxidase, cbb3-type subunit III [Psychrobacter halodurans]MDN5732751.1 cytochrome-c oxidase, cbb3-type subunit III [Psychrobacter sp.]OLF41221.1 cytochrome-c oxidase, cbb3-type subunit III [Psychrobacter sp. Rd 27.2]PJX24903.1 cytochrome-c oxidase, cbb3-type subunit III [Psychrobacter sp. L7]